MAVMKPWVPALPVLAVQLGPRLFPSKPRQPASSLLLGWWGGGQGGVGSAGLAVCLVWGDQDKVWFFNTSSASFYILIALCFCLQSPPKGATIPYRPKPASAPIIFAGGQVRADTILASAGNHTVLAQPQPAPVSFQLLLFFVWYSIDVLCLLCVLTVCRKGEHCIANLTQIVMTRILPRFKIDFCNQEKFALLQIERCPNQMLPEWDKTAYCRGCFFHS